MYSPVTFDYRAPELSMELPRVGLLGVFPAASFSLFAVVIALWGGLARGDEAPAVEREFRAAWVATVANIDWPSRRDLTVEQQQRELIAILDQAAAMNLNAIIFQVRPHCDALYASELEPWSEYLTGKMGTPPEPFYDPLELAVEEAHRRGLELHAWFNPYRAAHPAMRDGLSAEHISRTKPAVVRSYGKYQWLDPGEPGAAAHSLAVIMDVVRRYDIDGVHFDDYFYPYPINDDDGQRIDFPDEPSWKRAGSELSREDWRRQNVDRFVEQVYLSVQREKPWVRFGISPFGIWRPGYPESIQGFDAYANLYADARKWFREGHVDYLTPQLYWKVDSAGQSYPKLLRWWHEQNTQDRHLWPGNFTSRVGNAGAGNWTPDEIERQIEITRLQQGASGNVHFSMKVLLQAERGVGEALGQQLYREPALVPASPWLQSPPPPTPNVRWVGQTLHLEVTGDADPWLWVLQLERDTGWTTVVLPGQLQQHELESPTPQRVGVSTINRIGIRSPVQMVRPLP